MSNIFEKLEVIDNINRYKVSEETRKAMLESMHEENIHTFNSVDELFDDLYTSLELEEDKK